MFRFRNPEVQVWETEDGDIVVWGSHSLTAVRNAVVSADLDGRIVLEDRLDIAPDIRRYFAAPELLDEEIWGWDNISSEYVEGWVPFTVFSW